MNKVVMIGRLTADPDIRWTTGDNALCVARYTLAVDRRFKRDGDADADFIRCVAFGKQGEFAEKYLSKGMKIAISGRIQTGNYTNQDGQKIFTTDIVAEEHYFCESKGSNSELNTSNRNTNQTRPNDGFMSIPDGIDEELPFN